MLDWILAQSDRAVLIIGCSLSLTGFIAMATASIVNESCNRKATPHRIIGWTLFLTGAVILIGFAQLQIRYGGN